MMNLDFFSNIVWHLNYLTIFASDTQYFKVGLDKVTLQKKHHHTLVFLKSYKLQVQQLFCVSHYIKFVDQPL